LPASPSASTTICPSTTNFPTLCEAVVNATEAALNATVSEHGIQPEKIMSVIYESRNGLAVGDYEAKYRVIYRT
jgi:hypothetical protein